MSDLTVKKKLQIKYMLIFIIFVQKSKHRDLVHHFPHWLCSQMPPLIYQHVSFPSPLYCQHLSLNNLRTRIL